MDQPSIRTLRRQAKALLSSIRAADPAALRRARRVFDVLANAPDGGVQTYMTLQRCQFILAREAGHENWSALIAALSRPSVGPSREVSAGSPQSPHRHLGTLVLAIQEAAEQTGLPLVEFDFEAGSNNALNESERAHQPHEQVLRDIGYRAGHYSKALLGHNAHLDPAQVGTFPPDDASREWVFKARQQGLESMITGPAASQLPSPVSHLPRPPSQLADILNPEYLDLLMRAKPEDLGQLLPTEDSGFSHEARQQLKELVMQPTHYQAMVRQRQLADRMMQHPVPSLFSLPTTGKSNFLLLEALFQQQPNDQRPLLAVFPNAEEAKDIPAFMVRAQAAHPTARVILDEAYEYFTPNEAEIARHQAEIDRVRHRPSLPITGDAETGD